MTISSPIWPSTDSIRTTHEEGLRLPYTFAEDGTPAERLQRPGRSTSPFSGYKDTRFVYDAASKTYNVFAFDEPYMDANTDAQVAVTNVIVIPHLPVHQGGQGCCRSLT